MITVRQKIEDLEQQIYVACSEGNFEAMQMLEQQLESLQGRANHILTDDPYALEGRIFTDEH